MKARFKKYIFQGAGRFCQTEESVGRGELIRPLFKDEIEGSEAYQIKMEIVDDQP